MNEKKKQNQSPVANNVIDKDASNLKQERKQQKPDDDAVLHATHSNKNLSREDHKTKTK